MVGWVVVDVLDEDDNMEVDDNDDANNDDIEYRPPC